MKAMQVGAATALVVLIVADARAQQYSGVVPGTCVNGSITSDAVVSPSGVAGGLPVAPAIPGTFVGESIVSGGIVGQPISGGLATASPVVSSLTTSPAQGQILPYSYWVSAPQPRGCMSSMGRSISSPSRAGPTAVPTIDGPGITWVEAKVDIWRGITIRLYASNIDLIRFVERN